MQQSADENGGGMTTEIGCWLVLGLGLFTRNMDGLPSRLKMLSFSVIAGLSRVQLERRPSVCGRRVGLVKVSQQVEDITAWNDEDWDLPLEPNDEYEVIEKGKESTEDSAQVLVLGDLDIGGEKDEGRWSKVIDVTATENGDLLENYYFELLLESHDLMYTLIKDLEKPKPTRVQGAVIPWALEGRDVVICSHTGTGKTMAFLIPVIEQIDEELDEVQAVIVAPSRELAMQIYVESEKLTHRMDVRNVSLIGGANPLRQIEKLRKQKPHIVVGTPGRITELFESGKLRFGSVKHLVIDEVDQCLSKGFLDPVKALLINRPRDCQTIFASATADRLSVRNFSFKWMRNPILVRVESERRLPKNVEHHYVVVPQRKRIEALRRFLDPPIGSMICFVDNQERVDIVLDILEDMGVEAIVALRGDSDKVDRAAALKAFRDGKAKLLIATEVAARGLDLPQVSHVVNLDLPTDADHYIHRAGRCGRAGAAGTVVSLTTRNNAFVMGKLEKEMNIKFRHSAIYQSELIPSENLPEWVREKREKGVEKSKAAEAKSSDDGKRERRSSSTDRQKNTDSRMGKAGGNSSRRSSKQFDESSEELDEQFFIDMATFVTDDEEGPDGEPKKKKKKKKKAKRSKETERSASYKKELKDKSKASAGSSDNETGGTKEGRMKLRNRKAGGAAKAFPGKKDGPQGKRTAGKGSGDSVDDGDDDDDVGMGLEGWTIEGRSSSSKKTKTKPARRKKNTSERAKDEGWVGNR